VEGVAVELDHHAVVGPDEVALVAEHEHVDDRVGQALPAYKGEEECLQLALGRGGTDLEQRFDGADPLAAGIPCDQVSQ